MDSGCSDELATHSVFASSCSHGQRRFLEVPVAVSNSFWKSKGYDRIYNASLFVIYIYIYILYVHKITYNI